MPFDWNKYFLLAEDIYKNTKKSSGDNEALQRTAISRAYYSVHHLATEHAETMGHPKPTKDHHTDIIGFYKSQMDSPNHQEAGKTLAILHRSRKKCDYDSNNLGDLNKLLESSLIQAKTIKSLL